MAVEKGAETPSLTAPDGLSITSPHPHRSEARRPVVKLSHDTLVITVCQQCFSSAFECNTINVWKHYSACPHPGGGVGLGGVRNIWPVKPIETVTVINGYRIELN